MKRSLAAGIVVAALAGGVVSSAVAACASFDETGTPAVGPDASDDAVGDAPASDASATPDAAPSCIPEPVEPFDAGAEDAACGPNGEAVQLDIDPANCGFCGNECGEGSCEQGACRSRAFVVSNDPGAYVVIGGPDGMSGLYFAVNDDGCNTAHMRRFDVGGDAAAPDLLTADGGGCMHGLLMHDARLYYVMQMTGIHVTSAVTPEHTGTPLISGPYNVGFVHVAPSGIFHGDGSGHRITLTKLDGSQGFPVHQAPESRTTAATGDRDEIWWTVGPGTDAGPQGETLWTRDATKTSSFALRADLPPVRALAVDAEYIYLGFLSGDVSRMSRAAGAAATLEPVTHIDPTRSYPRALSVAGDNLFIMGSTPEAAGNGTFDLYRAKKCGGRARKIGAGYMYPTGMVVTGKYAYYAETTAVRRFDLSAWLP